jgi:hypothetical protein
MAPVGLGAAGRLQLLGQGRAGRPQHQLATLAAGPRRRPGDDTDPCRVDQDHAAQVQHDVMVALADQVAEVLPQLGGGVGVDVTTHGHDGGAVGGVVADCNSGAMAASLPAERHSRPALRNALRVICGRVVQRCRYGVASGRTLTAWGPFWPWVMSNSTAWPSCSEPPSWMALAWTNTSLPDSGLMKP